MRLFAIIRVSLVVILAAVALGVTTAAPTPSLVEHCDVPEDGFAWQLVDSDEAERLARGADGAVPPTVRELEPFAALTVGLTTKEVLRRVGVPDAYGGSGIPYIVYVLRDCSQVWLAVHGDVLNWGRHLIGDEALDLRLGTNKSERERVGH